MILTRDQILAADDIPQEEVAVPEWGGSVLVRGMTVAERSAFDQTMISEVKDGSGYKIVPNRAAGREMRQRLAAHSMVDADGKRLFTADDVKALGRKSAAALERVVRIAQRLNGMTEADVADLEGNSDEIRGDDSSSA